MSYFKAINLQFLLFLSLTYLSVNLVFGEIEHNTINEDGSFSFRHSNDDIGGYYHSASGSPDNIVRGRYGSRSPATGQIEETVYTAGPRGFRANGPKIHRKMDLAQFPVLPRGSIDDPLADPYDDPTYSFSYRTPDQSRSEDSDATGRVRGLYSYLDDVGERHSVRYAAGAGTGFEVSNAVPDNPISVGYTAPLYKAHPSTRGKMTLQRGPNGSYKLITAGPDQRRAESRDADGLVRGTYSFLDDKGVQRTVEYIAGAGIGYRVVKNRMGPGTHINPSVADFKLTDTDFKLTNEFGRGAGGGVGGGIGGSVGLARGDASTRGGGSGIRGGGGGFGTSRGGEVDGTSADGGYLKKAKTTENSDDFENTNDVDREGEHSSTSSRREGVGGSSNRVKNDRRGSAAGGNRGGTRYREGASDRDDNAGDNNGDRSYNRGGKPPGVRGGGSRPSTNRNSVNSEERSRNRNRGGSGGSSTSRVSSSSSSTSVNGGSGYIYDTPSANNYNLNDDDVGGSLPPLITANRKILEIDRERDWVQRHRDSTVIKNVGKWYIGLPPGQSVRAHVQNIDLQPLGGRHVPSPSEALRQDEIADMVASMEKEGSSYSS